MACDKLTPISKSMHGSPENSGRNLNPSGGKEAVQSDPDAKLEKEFEQAHFLDLKEENLEYAVVHPTEGTEALDDWIVFVGGFATTKEQYKAEIINLVKLGKTVLFVNPDKGITPTEEESDYFSKMNKALPPSIANKSAAVSALLAHLHIQQADIVGNSQGAAVAVGLVGAHPEIAKRLVLDSPAGLVGKGSLTGLLYRVAKDALVQKGERTAHQHLVDPTLREYDADVWEKYYGKVNKERFWRLTKELPDIPNIDLRPALQELKTSRQAAGTGPEIVLFNAYSDVIFPQENVEKTLGEDPLQFVDSWAMYANKGKKHSKYTQPQPGVTPEEYFSSRDSALHQLFSSDSPAPDDEVQVRRTGTN
jgi:pimeloyl-ACP methyl ester carboxylesterase